ncbi:UDP-N-acetyl-D-mannosamine dehydrogenase [Aequorivita sp. SDUM287046]|uniref:UDP-N-acetyl-D-mannosamine dehydrogenase n=1 Tax=Aequorivita aurantiaca TaxID=3053356 RepID=A0ABT8DES2_9FLAO|nr:UDP-N-acetyl-D-mannosamine dehydrogenase [Aequorivita aurantiaca]MDN3723099.1 UDP-N-acetyl-D-mannosamine dehydrogenase [Aequorivita aurantiaca]
MENKPTVVMMGLGYIGLPTSALIASKGINVTGIDISQHVVNTINEGKIHIVEPDLDGLVHHVVKQGYLKASTLPVVADVYLIAVPTPFKENYQPDLFYVESAVKNIIPTLRKGALVILESTSPVGTTHKIQEIIFKERPDIKDEIFIAYCPERVLPGNVIYELEQNDRAIGGIDEESTEKAVWFYKHFVKGELHKTNSQTAEMCKLVENSSRDVQIAFANELSIICDKANINVWELIRLANKHPRVNILQPGTGVGGHCIAVDPWFIVSEFPKESRIIRAAREINNYKTEWVIEKVKNAALQFKINSGREAVIACMGLAFKPNIDDLRESPALVVSEALKSDGFKTLDVEPNLKNETDHVFIHIDKAIEKADILVFLVAHNEFKNLTLPQNKKILDFCGVLN